VQHGILWQAGMCARATWATGLGLEAANCVEGRLNLYYKDDSLGRSVRPLFANDCPMCFALSHLHVFALAVAALPVIISLLASPRVITPYDPTSIINCHIVAFPLLMMWVCQVLACETEVQYIF